MVNHIGKEDYEELMRLMDEWSEKFNSPERDKEQKLKRDAEWDREPKHLFRKQGRSAIEIAVEKVLRNHDEKV